jgi:hypothetical protein
MKLFISWSGQRSKLLAEALHEWMPKVINAIEPWLSSDDIAPGTRWNSEIGNQLENTNFGVLCLTRENLNAPWILFEAGALSKFVNNTNVVPFLLDNGPSEIQGPLAQFHALQVTRGDVSKLLMSMNHAVAVAGERSLSEISLAESLEVWWPKLEAKIRDIPKSPVPKQQSTRSDREVIDEILIILRGLRQEAARTASVTDVEDAMKAVVSSKYVITEPERGSKIAQLIARGEEEMRKIEKKEEGANFGRLRRVIDDLRMLDPKSPDAAILERNLEDLEHRDVLSRLKNDLAKIEDPGTLNRRINDANQLIREGKADPDLPSYVENAIARRDTIRALQGELTTQDALADLDQINKVLAELEVSRQKGLVTFFDQRINQDRALSEFMSELHQKRATLALQASAHKEARARSYMPEEGIRSPKAAVPLIKEALAIPDQNRENIERLQELLADWQAQERNWEEADALLKQSQDAKDILQKLHLARRARERYPYHGDVRDLKRLMNSACAFLTERLRQAMELGESELQNAPAEADRLRRENSVQPLQSFRAARHPINDLMLIISQMDIDERTDELNAQIEQAQKFLDRVKLAEKRRQIIATEYTRIHTYIDRSDKKAAFEAYDALPEDFRVDPEMQYLREQMDTYLDASH